MDDIEKNTEICSSLDNLKSWLAARSCSGTDETLVVNAPDGLRSIGFPDLKLEKFEPHHLEEITYCYDSSNQKPKSWTELSHLVTWSSEFMSVLENNKASLAALDMLKGLDNYPISVAKFHVDEAISVIKSALNFELGLNIQHPDTRLQNYAVNSILVEDSVSLHDIIRQVFACLYSKCVVRLVVKRSQFYSAALVAFLTDLMYLSGASTNEVTCICYDRRESLGNERFSKCLGSNKNSKLSVIAAVFKQTDTFATVQGIIESYFRDQYPNLIVLVEETIYDMFIKDWHRYYSYAVQIGSRLDDRTTIVESFNSKVQIDLAAIDIKSAHKMAGNVINVLKYRSLSELMSLLNQLRKVPYMTIWNDDVLFAREFCLKVNQSNDFWINHIPSCLAGRRFPDDILNYFSETVAEDMAYIYNSVYSQYQDEAEQLRKTQAAFMKKSCRLRTMLIIQAYTSLVTKSKSLKNGTSIGEAVAHLRRFQLGCLQRISEAEPRDSRIELVSKPVGLAILVVRDESSIKSKAVLMELVFKNLLLGNAVLLICPVNTLGVKFTFENDHIVPFKMVHESLPDISKLSLDSSVEAEETSMSKKQCPKNTYAIEILPEMTSETCESITVALGTHRKRIWYSNDEVLNYWSG